VGERTRILAELTEDIKQLMDLRFQEARELRPQAPNLKMSAQLQERVQIMTEKQSKLHELIEKAEKSIQEDTAEIIRHESTLMHAQNRIAYQGRDSREIIRYGNQITKGIVNESRRNK
jgi:DNA-binding transcriptional MerR regulator